MLHPSNLLESWRISGSPQVHCGSVRGQEAALDCEHFWQLLTSLQAKSLAMMDNVGCVQRADPTWNRAEEPIWTGE